MFAFWQYSIWCTQSFYEDIRMEFFASVYIEVENYSRWPLSNTAFKIIRGKTTVVPLKIDPAYKEAFVGEQTIGREATEGLYSFRVADDIVCVVYWKVEGNVLWRDGNEMGVGCTNNNGNILQNATAVGLDYVTYKKFGQCQETMFNSVTETYVCRA